MIATACNQDNWPAAVEVASFAFAAAFAFYAWIRWGK